MAAAAEPLRLEAEVKGRWLPIVGSKKDSLLVERDGAVVPVDRVAPVRLAGDPADHLDFVRAPSSLVVSEVARPSASREPRRWHAYVTASGSGLTAEERKAAGLSVSGWVLDDPARALAAALWIVDGRIAQLRLREVSSLYAGNVGVERTSFDLEESQLGGTAAWIAFLDGRPVPVAPHFADPTAQRIAALVALGRDAEAAAAADGLAAVPEPAAGRPTLLTHVVRAGAMRTFDRLLALRAPLEPKGKRADRALETAIAGGRLALVERLLALKCSTTAASEGADSPLHAAVEYGNLAVCRALVAAKADYRAEGRLGLTPLVVALNHDRAEIAAWLLGLRARFPESDEQSNRVLITKASNGQLELVRLYREHGARPDYEWNGHTALRAAAREGHADVVEYLLMQKVAVDRANDAGATALVLAAGRGHADVVARLLAAKANPNVVTKKGVTPLLGACFVGSGPTVKLLLEAGANPAVVGPAGAMPLRLALTAGSAEAVAALLARGAKVDPAQAGFDEDLQAALAMDSAEFLTAALAAGMGPEHRLPGDWPIARVAQLMSAKRCLELLGAAGGATAAEGGRFVPMNRLDTPPTLRALEVVRDPRDLDEKNQRSETVVVEAVIDETGAARFARATCPDCRLSRAATESVRRAVFTNAVFEGRAVATRVRVPIRFVDRSEMAFAPTEVDVKPTPKVTVIPEFPFHLKRQGIQGRVTLQFVVTPTGEPTNVRVVSSSHPDFEEAALEAFRKWRFSPGLKDGVAVPVDMQLPIGFALAD